MKRIVLFIVGGLFLTVSACKKGENDPTISLTSRKARLAGEYTIDSWSRDYTNMYSNGDKEEVSLKIEGTSGKRIVKYTPEGEGTTTTEQNVSVQLASFTIDKDGTWSAKFERTTTWTEDGDWLVDHIDYTQMETTHESGKWGFLKGQGDDFKNKERVMFSVLNSLNTSKLDQLTTFVDGTAFFAEGSLQSTEMDNAQGEVNNIFEIDMLKGKEMVFVQDLNGTVVYKSTSDGITFTSSTTTTGEYMMRLTE